MNIDSLESREKIVNGLPIYLVEPSEWEDIARTGEFFGKKATSVKMLWDWVEGRLGMTKKHPEISLALHQYGYEKFGLSPIIVLRIDGVLQRVHIERLTCGSCGSMWLSANPMLSELYSRETWVAETRKAENYPVPPCPDCGTKLPRDTIWLAPFEE